ncbi:MAG: hypothetical protein O3C61_00940 [Proteobacteria bacterium]|nr:hypothetical protein [Pseudomonadota bacterium]
MNWFMIIMTLIAIAMFFVVQHKSEKYKNPKNKIRLILFLVAYLLFVYYFDTTIILK